jgi:hypothetical protein
MSDNDCTEFALKGKIKSCDHLRWRLRKISDDLDFNWRQFEHGYHPQECMLMAKNGPLRSVDHLDQITDDQWYMIDILIAAHDKMLAKKAKAEPSAEIGGDTVR